MTSPTRLNTLPRSRFLFCTLPALTASLAVALIAGCGGSGTTTPTLTGNTSVTLLASSTANDQLAQYKVSFSSITLGSQSGKTVTISSAPVSAEFMHLNGTVEPLVTTSIPQDIYTSATATIAQAYGVCMGSDSATGGLVSAEFGGFPSTATLNLPAPITVTGTSMGLVLDLQVSQSTNISGCNQNTTTTTTLTPTFNVTPVVVTAQPTNSSNGKATGLRGIVSLVDAGGTNFTVSAADGPTWQLNTSSSTQFQGVSSASALEAGVPVDMDAAIQSDGTLLATRINVYDTNPANVTVIGGPMFFAEAPTSTLTAILSNYIVENQGPLLSGLNFGWVDFDPDNAPFQVSGQLTNLGSLPFTPSFDAANVAPGQNVFISTQSTAVPTGIDFPPASTVNLFPQTINGTISAVSTSGNFTTYTVTLAPYDLFPLLAAQYSQTNSLANPGSVVVYVGSNTQLLNQDALVVGSVLRFNGLIFNDSGTLRMDCAQINDGVKE